MNADLPTDDLKRKRASKDSSGPIGQPDVEIERVVGGWKMKLVQELKAAGSHVDANRVFET